MASQNLMSERSLVALIDKVRDNFITVAKSSPVPIDWAREAGFAKQIIMKDERLLQSDPNTVMNAITNIAMTGLTLNPIKQHAAIVSKWNKDKAQYDASLMVMYRGLVYLAGQAGVTQVVSEVVYSADQFQLSRTDQGDRFDHQVNVTAPRDNISNKFIGVYVAAKMPGTGLQKVEWIPCEDIYHMRNQSDGYLGKDGQPSKYSPWTNWFDEMAKKCGLKRAQKRWEEAVIDDQHWTKFKTAVTVDHETETGKKLITQEEPAQPKLSTDQITEIERLAKECWPSDDGKHSLHWLQKICRAYRCESLSDIESKFYDEILERIEKANAASKQKRAAP